MIKVTIPDFVTTVKLSNGRRAKYYTDPNKVPEELQNKPHLIFKKGRLFNAVTKKFVISNEHELDKPRFQNILGNVLMRCHERIRMKMVDAVKDDMVEKIIQQFGSAEAFKKLLPPFPLRISCRFFIPYRKADWDIGNNWFYPKCFEDALQQLGVIKNDNILFVTDSSRCSFSPISVKEQRRLVFTIEHDTEFERRPTGIVTIVESADGDPGQMLHDEDDEVIYFYTGKRKKSFGKAKDALTKTMYYCLNHLLDVEVRLDTYQQYKNFFEDFKKVGINITTFKA
jgi:hypothetical protein